MFCSTQTFQTLGIGHGFIKLTKIKSLEIGTFKNNPSEEKILWWAERGGSSFPPETLKPPHPKYAISEFLS